LIRGLPAMHPPRRIPSFCRATLAGLLAILVFAVANLVHLPALHDALHGHEGGRSGSDHAHLPHSGEDHSEGACAISFFAQGIATPVLDLLARRPDEKPVETLRLLASAAPRFTPARRLPPSQAPPAEAPV
jgi:hypothetical protein